MGGLFLIAIIASVTVWTRAEYSPVYGFDGAASTVTSGKTLHYYIRLNRCTQRSGTGFPEYAEPFGSHVTKWRTYNDKERAELPDLSFHEQIPVLNGAGKLESLSRDVRIWSNGTVLVTTSTFTPDYAALSYMYTHECSMSTPSTPGDIDFRASNAQPIRLNSFNEIASSLITGEYLHFNAMIFLCPGGEEHTFAGLGGRIPNYEFTYDSSGLISAIKVFVQTTFHYDTLSNYATVIDFVIDRDNSVTIVDTRNSLPNFIETSKTVLRCPLEVGPPGGMFSVFV